MDHALQILVVLDFLEEGLGRGAVPYSAQEEHH